MCQMVLINLFLSHRQYALWRTEFSNVTTCWAKLVSSMTFSEFIQTSENVWLSYSRLFYHKLAFEVFEIWDNKLICWKFMSIFEWIESYLFPSCFFLIRTFCFNSPMRRSKRKHSGNLPRKVVCGLWCSGYFQSFFNPFVPIALFLYPLKTEVLWCFQGIGKGWLGTNGLNFCEWH